jgi:hypothetical protein
MNQLLQATVNTCPKCEGRRGSWGAGAVGSALFSSWNECGCCNGRGIATNERIAWYEERQRLAARGSPGLITLGAICLVGGVWCFALGQRLFAVAAVGGAAITIVVIGTLTAQLDERRFREWEKCNPAPIDVIKPRGF